MPPRGQARNPKPDSIAANPGAVRLLTSIFKKGIVKKGDKARKWHQHPTYKTEFAQIALEKFRKRYVQLYNEKFGEKKERKFHFCVFHLFTNLLASPTRSYAM